MNGVRLLGKQRLDELGMGAGQGVVGDLRRRRAPVAVVVVDEDQRASPSRARPISSAITGTASRRSRPPARRRRTRRSSTCRRRRGRSSVRPSRRCTRIAAPISTGGETPGDRGNDGAWHHARCGTERSRSGSSTCRSSSTRRRKVTRSAFTRSTPATGRGSSIAGSAPRTTRRCRPRRRSRATRSTRTSTWSSAPTRSRRRPATAAR